MSSKTVLVTGSAGFIGGFLIRDLLINTNYRIVGFDNLNDYYDISIKEARLDMLDALDPTHERYSFIKGDLADKEFIESLFDTYRPDVVVNLGAQAGVRYSIDNPDAYIESNLIGFYNLLEACRHYPVKHLVYASSSSVYGLNKKTPYSTYDKVDKPVSLYAATKKSDELLAHAYCNLYDIPCTGLRFFTVYGPMGRPDMAYFKFTNKIVKGEPIQLYNHGDMYRDFTYIDDIVKGVAAIIDKVPDANEDGLRYKIYNIGNNKPETLKYFVETLEEVLMEEGVTDKPAEHQLLPMQPGDVYQTYADVSELEKDFGFKPSTSLKDGLREFAKWYKEFYR